MLFLLNLFYHIGDANFILYYLISVSTNLFILSYLQTKSNNPLLVK